MDTISNGDKRAVREQMEANERALSTAHDAPLNEAMDRVAWERRGFLGRLIRRSD
jgi:hypothetical protein